MTNEELWLVDKLVRYYDHQHQIDLVKSFLQQQSSLPSKLRFKYEDTFNLVNAFSSEIESLFEKNPDFRWLTKDDRCILLERTLKHLMFLSSVFTFKGLDLYEDPHFCQALVNVYGRSSVSNAVITSSLFNSDMTVVKLMFSILMFSTIEYIDERSMATNHLSNPGLIQRIQNQYLEILWKYLNHRYSLEHAVRSFSNIVRCVLSSMNSLCSALKHRNVRENVNCLNKQAIERLRYLV